LGVQKKGRMEKEGEWSDAPRKGVFLVGEMIIEKNNLLALPRRGSKPQKERGGKKENQAFGAQSRQGKNSKKINHKTIQ